MVDVRERRDYDEKVGAGTYVFGLSDGLCVDATRVCLTPTPILCVALDYGRAVEPSVE